MQDCQIRYRRLHLTIRQKNHSTSQVYVHKQWQQNFIKMFSLGAYSEHVHWVALASLDGNDHDGNGDHDLAQTHCTYDLYLWIIKQGNQVNDIFQSPSTYISRRYRQNAWRIKGSDFQDRHEPGTQRFIYNFEDLPHFVRPTDRAPPTILLNM